MIHSESAPGTLPTINGASPTSKVAAIEAVPTASSTAGEMLYDGSKVMNHSIIYKIYYINIFLELLEAKNKCRDKDCRAPEA